MGRSKHYSLEEKAQAIALLDAEGGNQSEVYRQTGISRRTLRDWYAEKDKILADLEKTQKLREQDTELSQDEAEDVVKNADIGSNYKLVKSHMASSFAQITTKAQKIAYDKLEQVDAKTAMWIASVGIDKLMKLKGEPDQVVEVRNVVVNEVIQKLLEAVDSGIIERVQAEKLAEKFDEIEEADYEEIEE